MTPIDSKLTARKRRLTRYLNKHPDSPYASHGHALRSRIECDYDWYVRHFNLIDACYPYQYLAILCLE